MNTYFSLSDKIYDITERYPVLLDFLANSGFENLRNDMMRKTIGKTISIEKALRSKRLDTELFEKRMIEVIELSQAESLSSDITDNANRTEEVKMSGILPCPIRLQLVEQLNNWIGQQDTVITHELQAASMGLEWMREDIANSKDENDLADIYLSAGFSLFYDRSIMGRYMDNEVFRDITDIKEFNECFDNANIDLKDPLGRYTIIGVVPAVFMVNTKLLGNRPFPKSWEDLLEPEFKNSIALPMRDLDLFNAVLLGIYKSYGEEGVKRLGKGLFKDMHPAQMVKTGKGRSLEEGPAITVMPYFFTHMTGENSVLKAVWPKDGAIISPIFLLTKASSEEKIKPLVNYIFSKELGEVLTANGKFPSTHPDVDNNLTTEQTFMWPGWNFIHSNDISILLSETEKMFMESSGGIK